MRTTFFYVWPLWFACSFSGCEWAYCHGILLCEFSVPKCGGVLGGNDHNRAEKQNVVLARFRPVTGPSGHQQKTHKHFSDSAPGGIVPGTNPHPSQGQTGQNGDFTVELNRKRPVCPWDGVPVCPGEGSHVSQGRFLFVPDTVPPKMFMFIGFSRARL